MENKTEVVLQKPGFWRLFGAYFIDFILVQVIGFIIALFMSNALIVGYFATNYDYFGTAVHQGWGMAIATIIILFVLEWLYFSLLDGKGTFGKRCFNVVVCAKNERKITLCKTSIAYLLDLLLIKPIGLVITSGIVIGGIMLFYPSIGIGIIAVFVFSVLFPACVGSLYFSSCESVWGKTLGKKLMGLTVVQAKTAPAAALVKQEEKTK